METIIKGAMNRFREKVSYLFKYVSKKSADFSPPDECRRKAA